MFFHCWLVSLLAGLTAGGPGRPGWCQSTYPPPIYIHSKIFRRQILTEAAHDLAEFRGSEAAQGSSQPALLWQAGPLRQLCCGLSTDGFHSATSTPAGGALHPVLPRRPPKRLREIRGVSLPPGVPPSQLHLHWPDPLTQEPFVFSTAGFHSTTSSPWQGGHWQVGQACSHGNTAKSLDSSQLDSKVLLPCCHGPPCSPFTSAPLCD